MTTGALIHFELMELSTDKCCQGLWESILVIGAVGGGGNVLNSKRVV